MNVLLLQEDGVSPATVTTSERDGKSTVEGTLGAQRDEFSVLFVSLDLELCTVREKNASLASAVDEYKV